MKNQSNAHMSEHAAFARPVRRWPLLHVAANFRPARGSASSQLPIDGRYLLALTQKK